MRNVRARRRHTKTAEHPLLVKGTVHEAAETGTEAEPGDEHLTVRLHLDRPGVPGLRRRIRALRGRPGRHGCSGGTDSTARA